MGKPNRPICQTDFVCASCSIVTSDSRDLLFFENRILLPDQVLKILGTFGLPEIFGSRKSASDSEIIQALWFAAEHMIQRKTPPAPEGATLGPVGATMFELNWECSALRLSPLKKPSLFQTFFS